MLSAIILSVIILSDIMMSVITLKVIMLSVVTPSGGSTEVEHLPHYPKADGLSPSYAS